MIDCERSLFKKLTQNYNKDGLFDIIHIESSLKKNRILFKTQRENFIYLNDINENLNTFHNKIELNREELVEIINKNPLKININELFIICKEGSYKLIDRFLPLELIGFGTFSIVLKVNDILNNKIFALKIIPKTNIKQDSDYIDREVNIQSSLDHKNLLKFDKIINNDDYLYIFMKYLEGGSLRDLIIKRFVNNDNYLFDEQECVIIIKSILEGINYLHGKNIMHRDIKPENIMFEHSNDLNSLKILDFGLAIQSPDNKEITSVGTIIYMTPELLLKQSYDNSIDIWALGIILYILVSGGKHPIFQPNMNTETYLERIKLNQWSFPNFFPLLARNLFFKMCKLNKQLRYDSYKVLKHPWISRNHKTNIPTTLIESYKKKIILENFRYFLASSLMLYFTKNTILKIKSKIDSTKYIFKDENLKLYISYYSSNQTSNKINDLITCRVHKKQNKHPPLKRFNTNNFLPEISKKFLNKSDETKSSSTTNLVNLSDVNNKKKLKSLFSKNL